MRSRSADRFGPGEAPTDRVHQPRRIRCRSRAASRCRRSRSGSHANLTDAYLRVAYMDGADLYGSVLRSSNLYGTELNSARLEGADLRGARMWVSELRDADLKGADLRDADMSGADVSGAKLDGVDLRGADISSLGNDRVRNLPHGIVLPVQESSSRTLGGG
ncbi:pentapeptide repeat-containing protein [Micromonospora sp. NPDC050417]|uniref:pentapeptide repeat-containing protein n=1 Tax=Micromonospora sp. NPDC050417 TaxID=3364280 RepID=UPI00378FA035